jgi:hypothetical protein
MLSHVLFWQREAEWRGSSYRKWSTTFTLPFFVPYDTVNFPTISTRHYLQPQQRCFRLQLTEKMSRYYCLQDTLQTPQKVLRLHLCRKAIDFSSPTINLDSHRTGLFSPVTDSGLDTLAVGPNSLATCHVSRVSHS